MNSSEYINEQRRIYALYVLNQRAIPHLTDGLKHGARRLIWTARNGKVFKSATLAGACMPIHPHASPEKTVNTLAADYNNNIPLLKGDGAFGTLLNHAAFGASRYTSVAVSGFTKDAILIDIEIIPMQNNYDDSLEEPVHFLPLVPIVLLNPQKGIALGFASDILPRPLTQIIKHQIQHLEGKILTKKDFPGLTVIDQIAYDHEQDNNGKDFWWFKGSFNKVNSNTIEITNLPYKLSHEKFIKSLMNMLENGTILDYNDESTCKFSIFVKFRRGVISAITDGEILEKVGLIIRTSENMNVIRDQSVWTTNYYDLLTEFTDNRLKWYVPRYKRLARLLSIDIQRYKDILTAIQKNVGGLAKKVESRVEMLEYLETIKIVHTNYIADLPVYRFTIQEAEKVKLKLREAQILMKRYDLLLSSEQERRMVYITELKDILKKYG